MRLASDEELEQASQLAFWGGLKGGLLAGSLMGCGFTYLKEIELNIN